jgi:hypothetical protein
MKKLSGIALLLALFASHSAFAKDEQQNKTEQCAQEASGKSVSERYNYMPGCVQKKAIEEKPSGSQEARKAKLKACTTEAKGQSEGHRKQFVKQCMKKK